MGKYQVVILLGIGKIILAKNISFCYNALVADLHQNITGGPLVLMGL